jgi:FkbM family methyltransferase
MGVLNERAVPKGTGIALKQPRNDPNFAEHPIHGIKGQAEFFAAVMRHVRQRRAAIDAGAHIGIWTRMLSASFKEVFSFEPQHENFECLKANISDRPNVACFQVALGAHKGTVGLTVSEAENSGMYHVTPTGKTNLERLDHLCEGVVHDVDLMKIDVEGFEGFVLSGALKIMERDKPVVVFEDNGLGEKYYEHDWLDPKEVLECLGYRRISRIRKDEIWAPAVR